MFRMSLSPCLQVPKVTKSLGLGSLHPHSLLFLAFQLGEYVMTQVPQGCCSVFDNPGTALVPLGAALLAPSSGGRAWQVKAAPEQQEQVEAAQPGSGAVE